MKLIKRKPPTCCTLKKVGCCIFRLWRSFQKHLDVLVFEAGVGVVPAHVVAFHGEHVTPVSQRTVSGSFSGIYQRRKIQYFVTLHMFRVFFEKRDGLFLLLATKHQRLLFLIHAQSLFCNIYMY